MAYEFKTLGSVEALTEVPENAHALVEVDGAIKRVPGGALGGNAGGGDAWDFIIEDQSGSMYNGISWVNSDALVFVKGDAASLYGEILSGNLPRVCFGTRYQTSYNGTMCAYFIPTGVATDNYSGYKHVYFSFVEYDTNNGSVEYTRINLSVDSGSFSGGKGGGPS